MSTTRICLIRHGETEWNRRQIFRGISDMPLNENGRKQAEALGRRFASVSLRSIYASKLSRALETAKAIAGNQGDKNIITVDEGLTDIHRGEWEGVAHDEVKKKYPDLYAKWFQSPHEVRFPGGESLQNVQRRAWKSFDAIRRSAKGSDVAVVSHHVVLRTILCGLFGLDLTHFRQFELHPASISEILLEQDTWVLRRLNDTGHLDKADSPCE